MIESTVNNEKNQKPEFPKLMVSRDDPDFVVLMATKSVGMCLSHKNPELIGKINNKDKAITAEDFIDFFGSVTVKQFS